MFEQYNGKLTPAKARKLVMYAEISSLELPMEVLEAAQRDRVDFAHPALLHMEQAERDLVQNLEDHNSRGIILDINGRAFNFIESYKAFKNWHEPPIVQKMSNNNTRNRHWVRHIEYTDQQEDHMIFLGDPSYMWDYTDFLQTQAFSKSHTIFVSLNRGKTQWDRLMGIYSFLYGPKLAAMVDRTMNIKTGRPPEYQENKFLDLFSINTHLLN